MQNFLVIICMFIYWLLVSLTDICWEANKIVQERGLWEKTKGGKKPMINWTKLAIRSFFLLVIIIGIIFVILQILTKIK